MDCLLRVVSFVYLSHQLELGQIVFTWSLSVVKRRTNTGIFEVCNVRSPTAYQACLVLRTVCLPPQNVFFFSVWGTEAVVASVHHGRFLSTCEILLLKFSIRSDSLRISSSSFPLWLWNCRNWFALLLLADFQLPLCFWLNYHSKALVTRAGRLRVLKCRWFVCLFFVVFCRRRRTFEIVQYGVNADWLAPLLITLFARADHVWAKYMGRWRVGIAKDEMWTTQVWFACRCFAFFVFVVFCHDCIIFRNCTLFLCFSTKEKEW